MSVLALENKNSLIKMPPKKREKETDPSKNPRIDHIQADHELFLQAFESKCVVCVCGYIFEMFLFYFRAHTNL